MKKEYTLIFYLFSLSFGFGQVNSDSLNTVIKKATKAIRVNKKDFDAYIARAFAKLELNNEKASVKDFSKAIELQPGNAIAWDGRGQANAGIVIEKNFKNPEIALNDYNKAIELDSGFAMAYNHRGWFKYLLRDKNGACIDWQKARELGSSASVSDIKDCN